MAVASSRLIRALLIAGGTLSVALGVLGIFLPLLPTTPFLLLAAFCYARSSQRLLDWLLTNRWFGEYIRNYREGRGIPLREKLFTLSLLWLTILATVLFALDTWPLRLVLLAIATGVTIHVARVKTFHSEPLESAPDERGLGIAAVEEPVGREDLLPR